MRRSPAEIVREYGPFPGADHVHGVTYDGEHVWFAAGDTLNAFDPASGKMVRSIDVAAHAGTAFDGTHLFQIAEDRIQKIDPQTVKESTRQAWNENGGLIPRRAIASLLAQGYIDTLRAVRGDEALAMGTFSTQHPGQRVDHIFTHGVERSRLRQAWIEYDRLAKYASDHFPVGLEIAPAVR